MRPFQSRRFILAFVASAVAVGSLLAPETALADTALFRVEQSWHHEPLPPVTTPGGAGKYQGYIQPYVTKTALGEYMYPPATAIVEPGNPIGGAFTLPTAFIGWTATYSRTPRTGWPGYTTITYVQYHNGPGKFGPNHGSTASKVRVVFPTTGGNPTPNFGSGNPVTATTTFDGRYDFSRAGSINVTPGPKRFGGTFRLFHGPNAGIYQYIHYSTIYKGYGSLKCQGPPGVTCTPSVVSSIGDFTSSGMVTRFLMSVITYGWPWPKLYKATTPTSMGPGSFPTPYGNASYIAAKAYYPNTIHPWTTGFAVAYNPLSPYTNVRPQAQGYDISLGGADITVTQYNWHWHWNSTLSTITHTTRTFKQYLYGVGRVVSMVRPRLRHHYASYPIHLNKQRAELWAMKVFFVPEAAGLLLLGVGIAAVLGLSRMRRP